MFGWNHVRPPSVRLHLPHEITGARFLGVDTPIPPPPIRSQRRGNLWGPTCSLPGTECLCCAEQPGPYSLGNSLWCTGNQKGGLGVEGTASIPTCSKSACFPPLQAASPIAGQQPAAQAGTRRGAANLVLCEWRAGLLGMRMCWGGGPYKRCCWARRGAAQPQAKPCLPLPSLHAAALPGQQAEAPRPH